MTTTSARSSRRERSEAATIFYHAPIQAALPVPPRGPQGTQRETRTAPARTRRRGDAPPPGAGGPGSSTVPLPPSLVALPRATGYADRRARRVASVAAMGGGEPGRRGARLACGGFSVQGRPALGHGARGGAAPPWNPVPPIPPSPVPPCSQPSSRPPGLLASTAGRGGGSPSPRVAVRWAVGEGCLGVWGRPRAGERG